MRRLMWAGVASMALASPATAFFFPGWPADGLTRPVSLYSNGPGSGYTWPTGIQTDAGLIRPPGAVVTPILPPGGPGLPGGNTPQTVPEPASVVLAALGIGAVAGRRLRKVISYAASR